MQLPVAAVVLHQADVSSSAKTFKSTSPVQVGLFLLGLKARGKLGAESLVTAYGGTHSLDLDWVRNYPLPAEGDFVLSPEISELRSPNVKTSCEKLGHAS